MRKRVSSTKRKNPVVGTERGGGSFPGAPGWGVGVALRQTKENMQQPGPPCRQPAGGPGVRSEFPPPRESPSLQPCGPAWPAPGPSGRSQATASGQRAPSPCSPVPLALVQEGGGEAWGRTTGAKALFCFTAEMTLAGENEKMPCVLLQFEGRVTEEAAMVGLDGTTATKQTWSGRTTPGTATRQRELQGLAWSVGPTEQARDVSGLATLWITGKLSRWTFRFQLGGPIWCRFCLGFQCDRVGPVLGQFTVVTWTPSLQSHPSFYPVAHTTEHPSNAHI